MIQYNPPPFPNIVMAVMKVFVWHFTFQIEHHQQKEIQLREYYIHHHQILTKIIVWRGDAYSKFANETQTHLKIATGGMAEIALWRWLGVQ